MTRLGCLHVAAELGADVEQQAAVCGGAADTDHRLRDIRGRAREPRAGLLPRHQGGTLLLLLCHLLFITFCFS